MTSRPHLVRLLTGLSAAVLAVLLAGCGVTTQTEPEPIPPTIPAVVLPSTVQEVPASPTAPPGTADPRPPG